MEDAHFQGVARTRLFDSNRTGHDVDARSPFLDWNTFVHGPGRVIHEQVGSIAGLMRQGFDEDRIAGPDMQDGRAVPIEEPPEAGLGRGAHLVESGPENYCLH